MKEAAEAPRLTAVDLSKLRVVDEIISEPIGGAHRNVSDNNSKSRKGTRKIIEKI